MLVAAVMVALEKVMEAEQLAREIVRQLRAAGYEAWLVGGCVRDLLRGEQPKDWDVATAARPEQVTELFPDSDLVGAHFGVLLVRQAGAVVEVATFRSEYDYRDGRHPERVRFENNPQADAARRDFTINAMMMDPFTGEVLDYFGGQQDLARRLVRTVGEARQRFGEDHLRLLRAVRFAARLGFDIEPATLAAIKELAPLITKVSAERVRDELVRILTEGGARRGFELLDETGLLNELLPEVAAMKGVEQPPEFHPEGDVWTHTLIMLERMGKAPITLALGVLLHDVGKPPTFRRAADRIRFDGHAERGAQLAGQIMTRLRFPHQQIERVQALVAQHMRFRDVMTMKESTLKRFLRMEGFDEHLELHRVDSLSSHGNLANWEYARRKREELPAELLRPARLVTGHDLAALGLKPGPRFREILEAVETLQLEGKLRTAEEALEFVRENYGK